MIQKMNIFWILVLTGLLTFPSAVELTHVFVGHQHSFCNHYSDSHFHQDNLDCELFSFQKSAYPSVELFSYTFIHPAIVVQKSSREYHFLSTHQPLPFGQRGPPS
jgi:hypothetical protein